MDKALGASLKVLHLSDIHFAGKIRALDQFFDRIAAEDVDLVFLTGDVIDHEKGIPSCVENLKKLKPRIGKYAVFGNHDYYNYRLSDCFKHHFPGQGVPESLNPIERLAEGYADAGVHLLKNETVEILNGRTPLLIHGLDDPTTGKANLRTTMKNFDPEKINLLLTHTIDVFLDIGEGEIDVSFSGHSHGGQVRMPYYGAVLTHTMMGRAYAAGIIRHQGATCVVSRGMGSSRYTPVRFLCRPEALLIEIHGS
ncbi:MAG: metallophosphoesterase [Candidatus Omnitrophota bacterium]|nr:metallophosphoesterase [Candidatus Omnitrophota bacterium]